jgi:HD superfamily phosphohydrolase
LLHDIGHGPFSHLFEEAYKTIAREKKIEKYDHEKMTLSITKYRLSEHFSDVITVEDIFKILDKEQDPIFMRDILDSAYDVDKLDYINRDTYHCGTIEYGNIDFDRVIDSFKIKKDKLIISKSALGAVMNSFNSLQLAYENIYFHKTCRIFDLMIINALKKIPDDIIEIGTDLNKLLETDDCGLIMDIKNKCSQNPSNYNDAWQILKGVLDRKKMYSLVYQHNLTMGVNNQIDDQIIKLKEKYESKYPEFGLIFDYTGHIKSLRLNPKKTYEWLLNKSQILDEDDNELKNLKAISKAYYNTLTSYQMKIYIFINRTEKGKALVEKIKDEIKDEIESLEEIQNL